MIETARKAMRLHIGHAAPQAILKSDQPIPVDELAVSTGAEQSLLARLLRFVAAHGDGIDGRCRLLPAWLSIVPPQKGPRNSLSANDISTTNSVRLAVAEMTWRSQN